MHRNVRKNIEKKVIFVENVFDQEFVSDKKIKNFSGNLNFCWNLILRETPKLENSQNLVVMKISRIVGLIGHSQ